LQLTKTWSRDLVAIATAPPVALQQNCLLAMPTNAALFSQAIGAWIALPTTPSQREYVLNNLKEIKRRGLGSPKMFFYWFMLQ